jgi:Ca2+-binding EF-hand superfamily protein
MPDCEDVTMMDRSLLVLTAVAAGAVLLPGCASAPAPDPRSELERHHDEYWAYLAANYDRNGDARVEAEEYTRRPESFARLDRDRDGAVTRRDFDVDLVPPPELVAPLLLVRATAGVDAKWAGLAEIRERVRAMDLSGDGRVDRAEYLRAEQGGMLGVDRFGTLLQGLDADGDGLLSMPEVEQWLACRDTDGDGVLLLRERAQPGSAPREGFIDPESREPAPDFVARSLADGQPIALASILARSEPRRPMALIFGSFT